MPAIGAASGMMPAMRRKLFTVAAAVSAVLCVIASVLWAVAAYRPCTVWSRGDPSSRDGVRRVRMTAHAVSNQRITNERPITAPLASARSYGNRWGWQELAECAEGTTRYYASDGRLIPNDDETYAYFLLCPPVLVGVTSPPPIHLADPVGGRARGPGHRGV